MVFFFIFGMSAKNIAQDSYIMALFLICCMPTEILVPNEISMLGACIKVILIFLSKEISFLSSYLWTK